MLSRRSFLGGIIATIGLALTNTKLPRVVDELGPEEALAWDWRTPSMGSFTLLDCTFIKGDPTENDPDWIQTYGSGDNRLAIVDKTIQIADTLVLPHRPGIDRFITGCTFIDVPLVLQHSPMTIDAEFVPTDRSFLIDNTFQFTDNSIWLRHDIPMDPPGYTVGYAAVCEQATSPSALIDGLDQWYDGPDTAGERKYVGGR